MERETGMQYLILCLYSVMRVVLEKNTTCKLSSDIGWCCSFRVNGTSKSIYGTTAIASADSPASNALGRVQRISRSEE